ncbi:hypothetical protein HOD75_03385 [archaeon]|jgi:hypothetical protein|nr:hypothetical protein [archaeon]MBT4241916.1 hypothetical protein [archaeon]MBT4418463.1 hypothetical protein [archaeon]
MEREFGDVLTDSWDEFKKNWKLFFKIFLLFYVLPFIIVFAISFFLQVPIQEKFTLIEAEEMGFGELSGDFWKSVGIVGILSIIAGLFYLFTSSCFYFHSIYSKNKQDFGKVVSGGKKYFWKYFGLMIVLFLFAFIVILIASILSGILIFALRSVLVLAILLVVLIVLGALIVLIKYFTSWALAPYFLIAENKRIIDSLRNSFSLVKGNWWVVFAYGIMLGVFILIINIIFAIIGFIFLIPFGVLSVVSGAEVSGIGFAGQLIDGIFSLIVTFITVPIGIILFKNVYLDLKKEKGNGKKEENEENEEEKKEKKKVKKSKEKKKKK